MVVTGAGGFVGRHVVAALTAAGLRVRAVTRRAAADAVQSPAGAGPRADAATVAASVTAAGVTAAGVTVAAGVAVGSGVTTVAHPGFGSAAAAAWPALLAGADAVVHTAGLAHSPLADRAARRRLRTINVVGTLQLARAAAAAGVADFVFISSIKALGERSSGTPLDETMRPQPQDCYGVAKRLAERRLEQLAAAAPQLRVVSLRPPLIYGAGVRANFAALARLAALGLPLPLAALDNRRSLLYAGNLADAIVRVLERRDVPGGVYHLADAAAISTPALIRALAAAQGRPARQFPVPPAWLAGAARLAGREAQWTRLAGTLEVSSRKFCEAFGWAPRHALADGLTQTYRH
ncbi:MAG: NAD-dependent epimerase/dehydratase family protein [Lautropia sp.]